MEDAELRRLVESQQGEHFKWSEIAKRLPGRVGKQCRERWTNHLDPKINKGAWSKEEDNILFDDFGG